VKKFAQINAGSRRFYWDAKAGALQGSGVERHQVLGAGGWVLGTGCWGWGSEEVRAD